MDDNELEDRKNARTYQLLFSILKVTAASILAIISFAFLALGSTELLTGAAGLGFVVATVSLSHLIVGKG